MHARLFDGKFTLNDLAISSAIGPEVLHAVLGSPSRVHEAGPPAPYGHRNNQIHIYDEDGCYFYEHHFTRLATGITFVFGPATEGFVFSPSRAYAGSLEVEGLPVLAEMNEEALSSLGQVQWQQSFVAGLWSGTSGIISLGFDFLGKQLSARRKTKRGLVSVHFSWPHDPRAIPRAES